MKDQKKQKTKGVAKINGRRQTVRVPKAHLKGTKGGRPVGTKKKFHFSQTRLGFMMKYETPLEYNILMKKADVSNYFYEPPIAQIKLLASASEDPSFKKPKFKKYLEEYEKDGLCCGRPKILTEKRRIYYNDMFEKKMAERKKKYIPQAKKNIRNIQKANEAKEK